MVRSDAVCQRVSVVLGPAAGRETVIAGLRRNAGGVEYVPDVLSTAAVGRLCLCPSLVRKVLRPAATVAAPRRRCLRSGTDTRTAAHGKPGRPDYAPGCRESGGLAA